jgi:hypothetical protein
VIDPVIVAVVVGFGIALFATGLVCGLFLASGKSEP